jgi:hypothetical protein
MRGTGVQGDGSKHSHLGAKQNDRAVSVTQHPAFKNTYNIFICKILKSHNITIVAITSMVRQIPDVKIFTSASNDVQIGLHQSLHFQLSLCIINHHAIKVYEGVET